MQKWKIITLGAVFLILSISSCKRDSSTNWNNGILAPLATTNLTIANLVADTMLKTNADSSLSLVYQGTIYSLNLADQYIHIPDTSIGQKYSIDSLILPNVSFYDKISLGTMAKNLVNQGSPIGYFLINQNGHYDSLSTISGISLSPFYFSAANFFQTATLAHDSIQFNVDNKLPVALQNVSFELNDSGSSTPLLTGFFAYIAPGTSGYLSYSLPGITITSALSVRITGFTIPGTGGTQVLIDTSSYIGIGAYISGLKVDSAIAIFQSQDIISQDQIITQNISNGRRFIYVDCNTGTLNVKISSSIPQPLDFTYKLLGAYNKNGIPLSTYSSIAPAIGGQPSSIYQSFDLSGYSINLTGPDATLFNSYTQIIIAHMDSTGVETNIGKADSIHIQYFLQNIKPNYIKGYMGRDTIHTTGSTSYNVFGLLNNLPNALQLNKASVSITVENGIGVDGQIIINNLTGVNANGHQVSLADHSASPLIGSAQYIRPATDFPLTPSTTTFMLNNLNSNITDFANNLPNTINYDLLIRTNPNGNNGTYNQFAYLTSGLDVKVNVNVPLSLIASNLTLQDSFNFKLGYSQHDVANILDGTLHLLVDNKFPLQANITLMAYDSSWHMLDTLLSNAQVTAASLNNQCRAIQTTRTILNVNANAAVINKIRTAAHAVMTVVFNTKANSTCNGQYLNIYSDYNIAAAITADFNYKVKF